MILHTLRIFTISLLYFKFTGTFKLNYFDKTNKFFLNKNELNIGCTIHPSVAFKIFFQISRKKFLQTAIKIRQYGISRINPSFLTGLASKFVKSLKTFHKRLQLINFCLPTLIKMFSKKFSIPQLQLLFFLLCYKFDSFIY